MSKIEDYNKTAQVYNSRYRDTQFEKYKIMLDGIKLKGKILDHGCGTGLLSEFLGEEMVGVDSSQEMLKIRGEGVHSDVEDMPFKDEIFDVVLSFSVLMNCRNLERAIEEIKRVSKSDGFVICTFLKAFESKIKPILEKHFEIIEKKQCGEDVGFILNPYK